MNVVHINTSRRWGGGEQQVLHLMSGLREHGVNSVLLARADGELFRRVADEPGLGALPFRFLTRHSPLLVRRLRSILLRLEADLLHLHDGSAATFGIPAARGLQHLGLVLHRRVSSRMRRNIFSRMRHRCGRVDAYIAVSESARQSLREVSIAAERVHVIPSGVDIEQLTAQADRDGARRMLGVDGQALIGTVSALEPNKDLGTFVRMAEILARQDGGLRFVIVGEGRERAALERQSAAAGLRGRLRFTGHLRDAHRTIAAMDAFAFPSLREGSPGVIKEAMALGVPIVAADAPGTVEVLGHDAGILVQRGLAPEFASAIRGVLASPARSRAMAGRALLRLRQHYSIRNTIEQTLAVYGEVQAARTAAGARGALSTTLPRWGSRRSAHPERSARRLPS